MSGVDEYYYRVASGNGTGESAYSEFKSFIVIDPPTLLPGSDYSSDGFTINWDAMDGIDSVLLEVSLSSSFSDFVVSTTLDGDISSYDLTDLDAVTSYYYRLRSKEGDYISSYSVVGSGLTLPLSIESLEARIIGSRSFEARWESLSGEIDYELSVSSDPSFEDLLPDYAGEVISGDHSRNYYDIVFADTFRFSFTEKYEKTEENDVGRLYNTSSQLYRFLILSEDRSVVLDTISLKIPSLYYNFNNGVIDTLDELNLYYNDYSVFISQGYWAVPLDRKDFTYYTLGSGSYNVGGLEPGEDYYYRLRGINGDGFYSDYSEVIEVSTLPEVMALPASEVESDGFIANWVGIGASTYRLEVSSELSFYKPIVYDNLDGVSHVVEGLVSGVEYFYRVVGYNNASGGSSYGSNVISVSLSDFARPIALPATFIRSNSFRANWTSDEDLMYGLEVSANPDFDPVFNIYYTEDTFKIP